MSYFQYGQTETAYLKRKDKKLGVVIDRFGPIEREITPDLFSALMESIISQQISTKAAETVTERFYKLLGGTVTPETVLKAGTEAVKGCGLSYRKTSYILGTAEAGAGGLVNFSDLTALPDKDIIKVLSSLKGVGVWTAEMLLIFALERPDVVSFGDLAIRRGMMRLYGHDGLSREQFEVYRKRYSPYGSVASLYLWALAAE